MVCFLLCKYAFDHRAADGKLNGLVCVINRRVSSPSVTLVIAHVFLFRVCLICVDYNVNLCCILDFAILFYDFTLLFYYKLVITLLSLT